MQTCAFCDQPATHACARTGALLCWVHGRIEVVGPGGGGVGNEAGAPVRIFVAGPEQRADMARILMDFWGKTDNMLTYGKAWDLLAERSVVAYAGEQIAGILSWAPHDGRGLILDLSVYPQFQGLGAATGMLAAAEAEIRAAGLGEMILSTTNDNVPALFFYQRHGFVIERVLPGVALAHHEASGESAESGFGGIPVRDEVQLVKRV